MLGSFIDERQKYQDIPNAHENLYQLQDLIVQSYASHYQPIIGIEV